jgi:Phosphotransferase enzyme family
MTTMDAPAAVAFPIDARLPELAVAADPDAMRSRFAQWFAGAAVPYAVEDCRIARIRYRQHTRCFVQYALTLRNTSTGELIEQWASGTMYAEEGRAARLWQESAQTDRGVRRAIPTVAFISELRMAVDFFPHDRNLPYAARLVAERDAVLDAAVLRAFGDGLWTITQWVADPVRYREHLALVVRYTVCASDARSGATAWKTFFLKTYPDADQPRRAYEQLLALAVYAAASPMGVRVDAPLACLDHLHALLIERTAGRPLDEVLRSGDDLVMNAAVRETARALATFNQSGAPTPRTFTARDQVSALERAERVLRSARPDLSEALTAIARAVAASLHDVAPAPTHRDMKPEHVLLAPSGPAFIDLDSCAAGDPVMDPALMLARFTALAGQSGDARRLQRAREIFTREYFARVPADWRRRLRAHYAGALVEVAAGIFHRQEPAWQPRVAALIAEAHLLSNLLS